MKALAQQIRCLPHALWECLLNFDSGYVSISLGETRYVPGSTTFQRRRVQSVAFVSVEDLASESARPLHVIGHLIDHHLGCGGAPDGPWLSGGGGLTPTWQQAGARLAGLFDLGYAVDEIAQSDIRDYFAQSLATYCHNRQRLNIADPQICKWFRSTLWNESFWRARDQ
jgi:hypothetical protein